MNSKLSQLALKTEYRSLKEDPAKAFYGPCLDVAVQYKRAAGYFASTVYSVVGPEMVDFARRGGKALLICSPNLSQEDLDAIAKGYSDREELIAASLLQQIECLLADGRTAYPTKILATLLAIRCLEIKIAVRADRRGLYHEKLGIFRDGAGEAVSFKGSANETWNGWHPNGNFESIEVFCSWRGGLEGERVSNHEKHFDTLWSERDPDIEVISFPSQAATRLAEAALKGLDLVSLERAHTKVDHKRPPLSHQIQAIESWERQGRRGILEHATGSGKTYTSILAIRKHVEAGKPAIVVVPSKLLLEQWGEELRSEFPEAALLMAGGSHDNWKKSPRLTSMTANDARLGARIVLATMKTAASELFLKGVVNGPHLLLVADEVHQIGSRQNSQILSIDAGSRLGVSATPRRYGDPEGTAKIFNYFGAVAPPVFTLADALKSKRLVPYEYFPHPVNLTPDEALEWNTLTKAIGYEMGKSTRDDEKIKILVLRRSRIAKKAVRKSDLAVAILSKEYREGQSWLVYCEDQTQLEDLNTRLRSEGLQPTSYYSDMPGDPEATLTWFKSFGGLLTSIRCLDEGIDIPNVSHALILASSQNPRQFIQRRGRVLRTAPGKYKAVVHDAIVVPPAGDDPSALGSLLAAEMARAVQFATDAMNSDGAAELRSILINVGVDPETVGGEGDEDE